jgi:RNA polymerase sigma-70 factor (ECF subfamily)
MCSLVDLYRPAVVRFARKRGFDPEAAEDVAQEVFLRIFDDRVLERADEARGRFRCLLLAVANHVMGHHRRRAKTVKRGGGRAPVSLDATALSIDDALAHPAADADFDQAWIGSLVETALGRLRVEHPSYHECLRAFILEERDQRSIARSLGKTETAVRNAILRGRAKLGEILRDLIRGYSSSLSEFEDEVRYVARLLPEET